MIWSQDTLQCECNDDLSKTQLFAHRHDKNDSTKHYLTTLSTTQRHHHHTTYTTPTVHYKLTESITNVNDTHASTTDYQFTLPTTQHHHDITPTMSTIGDDLSELQ
ncbi:hypothetical protein EWB00_003658 [Schistosoma japonicum]|uniref:Uncharacterized protein n=1 Tax=Schistosoma japonicum TaxID=6182 RepID=A0A4Z2DVR5_SCHJA|nr:hypothetical protein EWB00_003658 [Schistosoma japonicum]